MERDVELSNAVVHKLYLKIRGHTVRGDVSGQHRPSD